jgi:hypothetical protein
LYAAVCIPGPQHILGRRWRRIDEIALHDWHLTLALAP